MSRCLVPFSASLTDPAFFGAVFDVPSRYGWRVLAKVLDGIALDVAEQATFKTLAGCDYDPASTARFIREFYAIAGRQCGKTTTAEALAVHAAALVDYSEHLPPGARAYIALIASDTEQARVAFDGCEGLIAASPLIAAEVAHSTAGFIEFKNRNILEIHTNSFRAIRGRQFALVVLDELGFYRSDESRNPDIALRRAILPGLIPGVGRLIGISSPWARRGLLYAMHQRHYAKPAGEVFVIQGSTLTLNPSYDAATIAALDAEDAVLGRTEFGAQFLEDSQTYLDDETIDRAVPLGVTERPWATWLASGRPAHYVAYADLSGGRHDSAALAIAHMEGERAVLDCVRVVPSPHSPKEAVARFSETLKSYHLSAVRADGYAGNFAPDEFAVHNVGCTRSELDASATYLALLPYFTTGKLDLLDHARLLHELRGLERIARPGGKTRITHAPNAYDDVINACAGALLAATRYGLQPGGFIAIRSHVLDGLVDNATGGYFDSHGSGF